MLIDDARQNSVSKQKKRAFRRRQEAAKKRKQHRGFSSVTSETAADARIDELEEEFLTDRPGFGEVAQAPPELPSVSKNYKRSEMPNHSTLSFTKALQSTRTTFFILF